MGNLQATEMANTPELSREESITWHLRVNHYPPVPYEMVGVCIEAIDAYWEDDLDKQIYLPEGITFKGMESAPARDVIIQHHLDPWCAEEDWEEE